MHCLYVQAILLFLFFMAQMAQSPHSQAVTLCSTVHQCCTTVSLYNFSIVDVVGLCNSCTEVEYSTWSLTKMSDRLILILVGRGW